MWRMLNIALAFNVLVYIVYLLLFLQIPWLSPSVLVSSVLVVYVLCRYTRANKYLQASLVIHVLFLCAYMVVAAAFLFGVLAAEQGGNALGAAMLVHLSLYPACLLLVIGMSMLLKRGIRLA